MNTSEDADVLSGISPINLNTIANGVMEIAPIGIAAPFVILPGDIVPSGGEAMTMGRFNNLHLVLKRKGLTKRPLSDTLNDRKCYRFGTVQCPYSGIANGAELSDLMVAHECNHRLKTHVSCQYLDSVIIKDL